LNRLETALETGSWSQSYGYDRWGNRWVSSSSGYAINADITPTQQSHVSTATNRVALSGFSYDTSGNQTAQTRGGQSETLNYDSENRMTSFASGSSTTSYVYDGDGRRVKKVTGSETVVFVYNAGGQLIAEYGQPQGSGGTSYLTTDHLGSTRLVTDAQGAVKARHDYLPFGEETGAGVGSRTSGMGYGAMDSTRQRFTGQQRDTESGLDYFLARYYSASQGRFTSADEPLVDQDEEEPQSWNLYTYVGNSPLVYTDPLGLFKREVHDGKTYYLVEPGDYNDYEELSRLSGIPEEFLRKGFNNITFTPGQLLDVEGARQLYLQAEWGRFVSLVPLDEVPPDEKYRLEIGPPVPIPSTVRRLTRPIKPSNLPSAKKVTVLMEHVLSGHTGTGARAAQSAAEKAAKRGKSLFPSHMTEKQIESAIRDAYAHSTIEKVQGQRVLMRGITKDGSVIEMWFNRATREIETAYPGKQ